MQLKPAQLGAHLHQHGLAPIYVLSGEEPLQLMESLDLIRAVAKGQGYHEREVFEVESGFDWSGFWLSVEHRSLFCAKRLLELRMPAGKPGTQGVKMLEAYVKQRPEDVVLLVQCGKLDRQARWVEMLDKQGIWVQSMPLKPAQMETWLKQRLQKHHLQPSAAAVQLLLERSEGNLLAAAQEVHKLALLYPHGGALDEAAMLSAVGDHARYSLFDLSDAMLAADGARIVKIMQGLQDEGVEPLLVLWLVTRETRTLAEMAFRQARGEPLEAILQGVRSYTQRPLMQAALKRAGYRRWEALLGQCARLDRLLKGQAQGGRPWEELQSLALAFAGVILPQPLRRVS